MNHLLFDIAEKLQVWQLHTFVGDGRLRIPVTGGPPTNLISPISTSISLLLSGPSPRTSSPPVLRKLSHIFDSGIDDQEHWLRWFPGSA